MTWSWRSMIMTWSWNHDVIPSSMTSFQMSRSLNPSWMMSFHLEWVIAAEMIASDLISYIVFVSRMASSTVCICNSVSLIQTAAHLEWRHYSRDDRIWADILHCTCVCACARVCATGCERVRLHLTAIISHIRFCLQQWSQCVTRNDSALSNHTRFKWGEHTFFAHTLTNAASGNRCGYRYRYRYGYRYRYRYRYRDRYR